jgi:putative SOS response-associated peptidase YedK
MICSPIRYRFLCLTNYISSEKAMCFTVNVNLVKEELENRYGATLIDPDKYRPSYYYHAFGLPEIPALCSGKQGMISLLKWGLIPSWVRDNQAAEEIRLKTFNARAENVEEKPSFSSSFRSKRCIIPVRGFFEWQHTPSGKIPWYIYRADNDIMSLAGLWSEWTDTSAGEMISTFSVITTDANETMADIHNSKKRMPVILEKVNESIWLDPSADRQQLVSLMVPYPSNVLAAHTISDLLNRKVPERDSPEVIRPFSRPSQNTLF